LQFKLRVKVCKKPQEGTLYHGAKLWILTGRNIAVHVVELQTRNLQTRKHVEVCCYCLPTLMLIPAMKI
jgi:hypothetical protein